MVRAVWMAARHSSKKSLGILDPFATLADIKRGGYHIWMVFLAQEGNVDVCLGCIALVLILHPAI